MAIKVEVAKALLTFEAGYPQPEFALFHDSASLLHHLFRRLEPYGLRLTDIRVERGAGSVGDHHFLLHLFNYWMTVRVRVERIEITHADLPKDALEKVNAAILDVLKAVKDCRPELSFRAFTVAIELHVKLEGQPVREYLARFVTKAPEGLGLPTGSGVIFYFGPQGDRLLSSVTADVSAVVQDALYVRIHGVWDAKKVAIDSMPTVADTFVRRALESLNLQQSS